MGICEDRQLEWELGAAARTKPEVVQLVDNPPESKWLPVGMIEADPNNTCSPGDMPHGDVIRDKLRAGAKDEKASPQDRAAAAEALRVMYRE